MDINPDSLETIEITVAHQGPPILDPVREEWWRGKLRYELDRLRDKYEQEMDILRYELESAINDDRGVL